MRENEPFAKKIELLPARSWFWLVPTVAIFLVLISIGTLLLSTYHHGLEEDRRTLISDTLWAEQNLGFHLHGNEATLVALAQEIVLRKLTPNEFWLRSRNILTNSPELVKLMWSDGNDNRVLVFPGEANLGDNVQAGNFPQAQDASNIAKFLARPAYSEPYEEAGIQWCFEVHIPIYHDGAFKGQLIGVYSLNAMMTQLIPWWHAQKYSVSILDATGKILASKSRVMVDKANPSYQVLIDPPGHGLSVRITPYRQNTSILQNSLVIAIILLSAAIIWSLLVLRRHARERFVASQKLRFTSRLVTMGEMVSTLAHELNQPLSAITSYVTGSINKLEANTLQEGELAKILQMTATQAQRAGKIIRGVHEFVRRREPRREACNINQIVEEALAFIEGEARELKVRIIFDPEDNLPVLHADSIMLVQVVLNLAKNGLESMAESPTMSRVLRVKTSNISNSIIVSIIDNGCGIEYDEGQKPFSAFYSTKENGMGMGLNICRSIVEFHRGKLWFEPNSGGVGSVFCFSLPLMT